MLQGGMLVALQQPIGAVLTPVRDRPQCSAEWHNHSGLKGHLCCGCTDGLDP